MKWLYTIHYFIIHILQIRFTRTNVSMCSMCYCHTVWLQRTRHTHTCLSPFSYSRCSLSLSLHLSTTHSWICSAFIAAWRTTAHRSSFQNHLRREWFSHQHTTPRPLGSLRSMWFLLSFVSISGAMVFAGSLGILVGADTNYIFSQRK